MKYQGYEVNFSQPTMTQYNTANIERINKSMYEYPQQIGLASEKSDSDIWKWLGTYVTGNSGSNSQGSWGNNPNALIPKLDRLEKETKADHQRFGNQLTQLGKTDIELGNKLVEAKNERDRIEALIGKGKDCGFLGINCIFDNLLPNVSSTALLAGAGVAAYLLLGKKL